MWPQGHRVVLLHGPVPRRPAARCQGHLRGVHVGTQLPTRGLLPSPGGTHIVTRSLLQGASSSPNKSHYYLASKVTEWLDSRGAVRPSQVAAETWDPGVDNRDPPGPAPPVRPRPLPPRPPPAGRARGSSALSPGLDGSQHAGKKRAASGHLRRRTRSAVQLQSHAVQGAPRTWQLGPLWKPAAGIFSDVRWVSSACCRDEAGKTQAGCRARRGRRNAGCTLRWPHQGGVAPQGTPQQSSRVRASSSIPRGG